MLTRPNRPPQTTPPAAPAEERVYRHRCVEAWAIVVPWEGFPLRKLLGLASPLPAAKFIRFETDARDYMPYVKGVPNDLLAGEASEWPYVEGLSVEEGWNDLAFVSVGAFNSTLPAQSGAPLRLNVGRRLLLRAPPISFCLSARRRPKLVWRSSFENKASKRQKKAEGTNQNQSDPAGPLEVRLQVDQEHPQVGGGSMNVEAAAAPGAEGRNEQKSRRPRPRRPSPR